ncbi:MAG: hypothetical protein M0Z30_17700 [Actinomycetota bacterium]|nr:hypothetical protein [Actinomycetota bacterium]
MTSLVSKLERDGLVRRHRGPEDRRAVLMAITELGSGYLGRLRQQSAESIERLIDKLPATEAGALASTVDALVHPSLLDAEERDPARPPTVSHGPDLRPRMLSTRSIAQEVSTR